MVVASLLEKSVSAWFALSRGSRAEMSLVDIEWPNISGAYVGARGCCDARLFVEALFRRCLNVSSRADDPLDREEEALS